MKLTKHAKPVTMAMLAAGITGVIAMAATAYAGPPFGGGCGPKICLDVWKPVICSDGRVYSNDCYAKRACATGCTPLTY